MIALLWACSKPEFWLSGLAESRLSPYLAKTTNRLRDLGHGAYNFMEAAKAKAHRNGRSASAASEAETINFKVPRAFKREFKGYAVSQGLSMVELLREGFELSKQKRK